MEHKLTNKEALTLAAAATTSLENDQIDLTQNSLIIVTPAGVITGTYVSKTIEDSLNDDAAYAVFKGIEVEARKLCKGPLGSILLKDASLTTSQGLQHSFNFLHVFLEDIIALSIGNMP